jgi:hypothetical protein
VARTLAQLRTALQTRGYATDTAPAQTEAINSVYRRIIGMRRWPWLEVIKDTTVSTTAGDDSYTLASIDATVLHVDAVRAEQGTEYYELVYRRPQEFREFQHASREQGTPRYWTRIGDSIYLWPVPDGAYTLSVDFVQDPADLSGDSDTTLIPDAYSDVLVWGALTSIAYRERDFEAYATARQEYGTILVDMMNEYGLRQRQNASRVVESGWYDTLDEDLLYLNATEVW